MKTKAIPQYYIDAATAVMKFALANYDKGWDWVAESLMVESIATDLQANRIWSPNGAIKFYAKAVRERKAYATDIALS